MLQLGYLWLWLLITIFFCWNNVVVIEGQPLCVNTTFDCGKIKFTYPFWLINATTVKLKEEYCGYPGFGINCSAGNPILALPNNPPFSVTSINFTGKSLTVICLDFMGKSCPKVHGNYELHQPFYWDEDVNRVVKYYSNCSLHPPSSSVPYISCLGSTASNRSYVFESNAVPNFNWDKYCEDRFQIPLLSTAPYISKDVSNYGFILKHGFQINWMTHYRCISCESSGGKCGYDPLLDFFSCECRRFNQSFILSNGNCEIYQDAGSNDAIINKIKIGACGVAALVLIILLGYIIVYKRKRCSRCCQIYIWNNQSKKNTNVEVFLEDYGRLSLYRYRYSELIRITYFFKDKLGQGGYGGVFKGKLKDGRLVAVKVLTESKGNGEEFINEVATIGRTNHVNIVSLLGYCSQGPKRALVYEFMPNGSLEKFIYNDKSASATHSLGWEQLHQIALGIANGLEYLHRGCNNRILHFDIKPHNILLDEDFCPKISDFGLAKLCPTRDSIVSMLGTRGTIGYIAPEVYCRNFGGVSSKSDVYSFGMMVLEMVGGRKNIDATAENTSEIYFPQWIYNHLEQHGSIGLGGFREMFEEEGIKKMIIVGLWCIQTHPADRPSMSTVVEMLQKSVDDLQIPPNPFQDRESSQSTS